MNHALEKVFAALVPERGMWTVYPLLGINLINWATGLLGEYIFYEPSRFDGILALMFAIVIGLNVLAIIGESRSSTLDD